jgi:hypothetical protein
VWVDEQDPTRNQPARWPTSGLLRSSTGRAARSPERGCKPGRRASGAVPRMQCHAYGSGLYSTCVLLPGCGIIIAAADGRTSGRAPNLTTDEDVGE